LAAGGSPPRYRRVSAQPLHQSVTRQIARRIVSGELEPGAVLPIEPMLAEQFGVSRTVVREAVRMLVSMGLLTVRQGSGTRVRPPEEWDYLDPLVLFEQVRSGKGEGLLEEVLDVRRVLEVEVAGWAAERRTDEELAELGTYLEGMAASTSNPEEFTRLDIEFHERILSSARNRILREALRPINDVLTTGRFITARNAIQRSGSVEMSQRGHEEIYEAVADRDADAAREAMRRHVRQFEKDIHANLSAPDAWQLDR
jgi:GntR family transcriptional regulator, transcriptional repressor for pyruvate dehydrogenase complex